VECICIPETISNNQAQSYGICMTDKNACKWERCTWIISELASMTCRNMAFHDVSDNLPRWPSRKCKGWDSNTVQNSKMPTRTFPMTYIGTKMILESSFLRFIEFTLQYLNWKQSCEREIFWWNNMQMLITKINIKTTEINKSN
jgi:hypothetical protein